MIHISLFSGIGGFEIAAQEVGWKSGASCEINDFGHKVLQYHFPKAYHHRDVKTLTYEVINEELTKRFGSNWRAGGVILTGGFPCQDASIAKQWGESQQGLQGARTGLAFHMLRLIDEIKPRFIVGENVANFLQVNAGKDFRTILSELARLGYNAEWRVCRASDVGAPHHRERMYLVAYSAHIRLSPGQTFFSYVYETSQQIAWVANGTSIQTFRGGAWACEPPALCVDDGISGSVAGFTASQYRKEQIKAYGNAVVPFIPVAIFKAIDEYERSISA